MGLLAVPSCSIDCNCESCCDTCTHSECAHSVSYSVHEINPSFVPARDPATVTITGGYFLDTPGLQCRFGSAVVPAQLLTNNAISCTPPSQLTAAGTTRE